MKRRLHCPSSIHITAIERGKRFSVALNYIPKSTITAKLRVIVVFIHSTADDRSDGAHYHHGIDGKYILPHHGVSRREKVKRWLVVNFEIVSIYWI